MWDFQKGCEEVYGKMTLEIYSSLLDCAKKCDVDTKNEVENEEEFSRPTERFKAARGEVDFRKLDW